MKKRILFAMTVITSLFDATLADTPSTIDAIERELLPNQFLEGHLQTHSIAEVMLKDNIPGVSMTFIDDGTIAWQRTYGFANLGSLTPITTETVFAGASLSKPLAAVTAMRLVENGKISLDDDINRYLTSWKVPKSEFTDKQNVTLRHLIGHSAGVSNDVPPPYGVDDKVPTLTQMLTGSTPSTSPKVTLFATPGEQYKYSNPGYLIIQQLIEDVHGTSFETAVASAIFNVIGMDDSTFSQPIPKRFMTKRASGYNKQLTLYPYQIFPFKGAGGVWTTPTDLAKFAMTLIDDYHRGKNALVSRAMAAEIFSRSPTRLGFKKHYVDGSDDIVFDHWGSIPGFTSYMVGSVKNRQALVIMTNSDNGFDLMAAIARTVAQHYDWKPIQPKTFKRYEAEPQRLKAFTGKFGKASGSERQHVFIVKNGQLHLDADTADNSKLLVAIGERLFIDPIKNTTFEFLTDKTGAVSWVRVTQESGYNFDQPKQQTLTSFIEKGMNEAQVEGLSIAVIKEGKITFDEGFGVTNVHTGENIHSQTLFEAASLSKPIFALFTLKQVAQGVIGLDEPLYTYWPHPALADNPWHKLITARMVLTHTSGMPNWRSDTGGKLSLLFKPGTDFQYSSEGYEYLRGVIQKQLALDDDGLQALIDQQLTHELGATFMKYTWDNTMPQRKAFGHRDGRPTDNHKHDHNFGAAYSLTTTATDYAKFVAELLRPSTSEKQKIAEQLLELQTALPHEKGELHRALGFAVKPNNGRLKYFHSGNNGDFRSYVQFYRDTGDGIVMFSNSDKLFSSGLATKIVEFLEIE